MSINKLKRSLISIARNFPGKSIGKKVIVIECDDWGSIGMPSIETYYKLLNAGVPVNKSRYERNDTIEHSEDLYLLFEVLRKHKDKNGKPAVMSPFCNMANPDFDKIKSSNFKEYYPETFTATYQRYSRKDIMQAWQSGIEDGIFVPEYHGREHIATQLWLKCLQSGNKKLHIAFDHGFVGHSPADVPIAAKNFRPNFYIEDRVSIEKLRESLVAGIDIFKHVFQLHPVVFNAPNGVFVPELNQSLAAQGILFNAVPRKRLDRNVFGEYKYHTFSTGQQTKEGLVCYVRNCNFEPTEDGYKNINHVMNQISGAFFCGKAAVIGTHRANFVGGINQSNREKGLNELDTLLKQILIRWPDAEFMSSRQFTKILTNEKAIYNIGV